MISKERYRVLIPINIFHTMAHIFPYLLPVLSFIIREDIAMNYTQAALLSMMGVIVTIPLTILFGNIGDRISNWRLEFIIAGYMMVFSSAFIIYAANTYAVLMVAAVVGGIGSSVFHPIALPLLSQEFGSDRNIAHSFNLIFGTFGSIITPITSIALANWLGWKNTALIFGIAGGIALPIMSIFLLYGKKYLQYDPLKITDEEVVLETNPNNQNQKSNNGFRSKLSFITLPLIALMAAQIFRSGTFRVMNTFTTFIFKDEFGASELGAAGIMSIILGLAGVAAFVSGFISKRIGSLRTFIIAKFSTTISAVLLIVFIIIINFVEIDITIGYLILAVILFALLTMSFYFGSPSSNSLFAEMVPEKKLSTTFGVLNSSMTAFSALTPVMFGAIVDQEYSFPYEYLLLVVFSLIPLLLLLYVRSKIGLKTPDEVESEKAKMSQRFKNGL